MLPDFGAMRSSLQELVDLLTRIAVALERIAEHADEIHDDMHSSLNPLDAYDPGHDRGR